MLFGTIGYMEQTTVPPDGNINMTLYNEGRRSVWLFIQKHLREDDAAMREVWKRYVEERAREEEYER